MKDFIIQFPVGLSDREEEEEKATATPELLGAYLSQCRYYLIGEIYELCKKYKLYVSLKEEKHLQTRNPSSPMNFWIYAPQGDYDKAPRK